MVVASHVLELWLFGTIRTEIWRNAGTVPFTYQRAEGIYIEMGCAAQDSVQVMDNSIIWLARDERGMCYVCKGEGYTPKVISTEPLHRFFAEYNNVEDAKSYSYAEDGHLFYVLTFPTANVTWCYDVTTQLWHRRTSWNSLNYRTIRDLANCYAFFDNTHIVGDVYSGKLYKQSTSIYSENGNGLQFGQGFDPQVMLEAQKDGIWGTQIWRSAGKVGERAKRVRWNRSDIARTWIFRISMTDPVQWSLLSITADFEIGTS